MSIKKLFLLISSLFISCAAITHDYVSTSCNEGKEKKIYIYEKSNGSYTLVSPFHGIPLFLNQQKDIVNMIVEIPQGTKEKMEINLSERFNPLMFDITDGEIRKISYQAVYSDKAGYPFHYGALAQTWEHPGIRDPHTKLFGDNDPVDAFDISSITREPGDVVKVKVLGAIAMIDNNETDWKLIVINIEDELAEKYNNIMDVPWGMIETIHDFLQKYKTSEGKPENKFYKKVYWDKEESLKIIKELHEHWQKLCTKPNQTQKIITKNRKNVKDEIEMPSCKDQRQVRQEKAICPLL